MLDRCASMRSTMRCSTWGHREVAPPRGESGLASGSGKLSGALISETGTTTDRSKVLGLAGATTVAGARPDRNRATSAAGFTVAERPIRCAG
ncbi:Uncharacterised protein [Mycobacteroides abscessus subsp. abscessus]|nr:Uncharacterised protein [Mycobacteroides abscessus subsp. abscessus]